VPEFKLRHWTKLCLSEAELANESGRRRSKSDKGMIGETMVLCSLFCGKELCHQCSIYNGAIEPHLVKHYL